MRTKAIPGSWLHRDGRRFDAGPYTSGALEAKIRLEELSVRKDRLTDLTSGYNGGIFNGPQFSRHWVDSADHGVPFLGSSSMLMADLSNLPLLRRRDAESAKLSHLRIRPGTTLISCSGTIGRMVYVRPDMDGMWTSQDIMKVVPDPERIPPGYLYAFLSGKFGVPLVTFGTYGAIIQHIEPQHIAGLPVPRFAAAVEREVHKLVEEAASARADAAAILRAVGRRFGELIVNVDMTATSPRVSCVPASAVQVRLDGQFHDPIVRSIRDTLACGRHTSIGELCTTVFLPGIFKRIYAEDEDAGAPYYTGASLFWLEPLAKGILSRRTSLFDDVLLKRGTVLVQAFGQKGGLTGRAIWVGNNLHGSTTTHMLVRLRAPSTEDTAYLFGFLQSDAAYRQIAALSYGGSIPHFDESGIRSVVVPLLDDDEIAEISSRVLGAVASQDRALTLDRTARLMVEQAIEGSS